MKIAKINEVNFNQLNFDIYKEENVIIKSADVKAELNYNYNEWAFFSDNENVTESLQELFNHFVDLFNGDIIRIFDALSEKYNILDNYNGIEEITHGRVENTANFGKVKTTANMGKVTTTLNKNGVIDTNTHSVANSESALTVGGNFLDDSKDTTTQAQRTNETDAVTNTNETDARTDTNTTSEHTITTTKRGNLGTTTSQQMLTSEIDLRTQKIFTTLVIKMFTDKYLFLM